MWLVIHLHGLVNKPHFERFFENTLLHDSELVTARRKLPTARSEFVTARIKLATALRELVTATRK
jgi:hypothetical protein